MKKSFTQMLEEAPPPMLIEPLDTVELQKDSQDYWNKNKSKFKPTDTENLYKSGDDHNGYFMFVVNDEVEYFVKFKDVRNIVGQKVTRQVLVHRNKSSFLSAGIPKIVFFDYLIPMFGGIVTDTQQTYNGKRFWEGVTMDALQHPEKYDVYIYKQNTKETVKIHSRYEMDQNVKNIWGDSRLFEYILIAIIQK